MQFVRLSIQSMLVLTTGVVVDSISDGASATAAASAAAVADDVLLVSVFCVPLRQLIFIDSWSNLCRRRSHRAGLRATHLLLAPSLRTVGSFNGNPLLRPDTNFAATPVDINHYTFLS